MSEAPVLCELLPWDSEFFGLRVARVTPEGTRRLADADRSCHDRDVDVAYLLLPVDEAATLRNAEELGFRTVDVRMSFRYDAGSPRPAEESSPLRTVTDDIDPADLPALERIAARAHRGSRFYADPNFPEERCDALYATWIRRCVEDASTRVVVARAGQEVVGYVTVRVDHDHASIDLIAVGEQWRGEGVGAQLVRTAIDAAVAAGAARVVVATQGRNLGAQRLYQRAGMVTDAVQIWFHKWYEKRTR